MVGLLGVRPARGQAPYIGGRTGVPKIAHWPAWQRPTNPQVEARRQQATLSPSPVRKHRAACHAAVRESTTPLHHHLLNENGLSHSPSVPMLEQEGGVTL